MTLINDKKGDKKAFDYVTHDKLFAVWAPEKKINPSHTMMNYHGYVSSPE